MMMMIIMMLEEQWSYSSINRTGDEEAQRLIVDSRGRRTGIIQGVHFFPAYPSFGDEFTWPPPPENLFNISRSIS